MRANPGRLAGHLRRANQSGLRAAVALSCALAGCLRGDTPNAKSARRRVDELGHLCESASREQTRGRRFGCHGVGEDHSQARCPARLTSSRWTAVATPRPWRGLRWIGSPWSPPVLTSQSPRVGCVACRDLGRGPLSPASRLGNPDLRPRLSQRSP